MLDTLSSFGETSRCVLHTAPNERRKKMKLTRSRCECEEITEKKKNKWQLFRKANRTIVATMSIERVCVMFSRTRSISSEHC